MQIAFASLVLTIAFSPQAISQATSPGTSTIEQLKAAERSAESAGPRGSNAYELLKAERIHSVIASPEAFLVDTSGGPPKVASDPRYNSNLLWMANDSLTNHLRVWGGKPVVAAEFTDVVAIKGNGQICTGLLVAAKIVLTARHCVCDGVKEHVIFGLTALGAAIDTYDVTSAIPMRPCPTIQGDSAMLPGADVALLYLDKARPNPRIRAVASLQSLSGLKEVSAIGFGLTETGLLGTKMKANIPMASLDCSGLNGSQHDADYYKCVAGSEMVAGMEGLKKDTCRGDSGGPVFKSLADGTNLLVATTSRPVGFAGAANCGDGGIYELTQNDILKWLNDTNHLALKVI